MTRIGKAVAITALVALGSSAPAWAGNESKEQAQLERDKNALITRVQQGIDKANTELESLATVRDGQKGAAKDRVRHLEKTLTFMRDLLNEDRDKITSASLGDWNDVHAMVESDLSGTSGEMRMATVFLKPQTGVANRQPNTK